jgi:hypothetical protein
MIANESSFATDGGTVAAVKPGVVVTTNAPKPDTLEPFCCISTVTDVPPLIDAITPANVTVSDADIGMLNGGRKLVAPLGTASKPDTLYE